MPGHFDLLPLHCFTDYLCPCIFAFWAFYYSAPHVWNCLGTSTRSANITSVVLGVTQSLNCSPLHMTRRLDITHPPSALLIRMATQRYTKLPLFILYMAFLAVADVVSVKHHAYADDTQLYIRCQTQEATTAAYRLSFEVCIETCHPGSKRIGSSLMPIRQSFFEPASRLVRLFLVCRRTGIRWSNRRDLY